MGWRESLELVEDAIEITALMPAFDGALSSLEERYAKLPRFDTVEALLNDAGDLFEGALVCLPNNTGPDAVVALANAGKHILLEKPGAANAADARRMAQAVRGAKVAFQNGFMWRYDELTNRLRDMCREGRFGKLISDQLVKQGAKVIIAGRRLAACEEAAAELNAKGYPGSCTASLLDLASLDSVRAFAERFIAEHDRLDVLVENAAVCCVGNSPLPGSGFRVAVHGAPSSVRRT